MAVIWFVSLCKIMVKNKIRKSLLEQGQLLSNEFVLKANSKIQSAVIKKIDIQSSENILLYFPYKKEVTLDLLIKEFKKYSINIYMPRIISHIEMKFNLFGETNSFTKNKYGITELDNQDFLDPLAFDLMFIPFVGVDINGHRLGYGGGYFDRALQNLKKDKNKILIIGLGYEYQVLKESFGEAHDIKYDIVMTEKDIHSFK